MKKVVLHYSKHAVDDLKRLEKGVVRRIVVKVKENSELSNPLVRATALSGPLAGRYRYRIGDYRVVFRYDNQDIIILTILRIKHRREVYD